MTVQSFYLAWRSPAPLWSWFPIGRLDVNKEKHSYRFAYTKGAKLAHKVAGLESLDAFPDFKKVYEAKELFPLFRARVLDPQREDFREYLDFLDMSSDRVDQLDILAISGGERQTDQLEVFPRIERRADDSFRCRFFIHGWRFVNEAAQERIGELTPGDPLQVAVELNNPRTTVAIQLQTHRDYHVIGWTPRYLVRDLSEVIDASPAKIVARVVKVNPSSAPAKFRVLVELEGKWPKKYKPMSSEEFQLL